MKKYFLATLAALLLIIACSRVPVTNRRQLNLLNEKELISMSLTQYNDFLQQEKVVTNTPQAQTVKKVGQDIATATNSFMRRHNMGNRVTGFNWEFNLIQHEAANAFAMPGGKVAIFTGILKFMESDAELATVMSHEVAHVIARHGNERMSQLLAAQLGGVALSVAVSNQPQQTQELFMGAYGLGAQIGVLLPFSRKHESEADEIGLVLMAMAGYDPREAIDFWTSMAEASKGQQPPEFLSTHPSHETRIEKIKNEYLPYAMQFYRQSQ